MRSERQPASKFEDLLPLSRAKESAHSVLEARSMLMRLVSREERLYNYQTLQDENKYCILLIAHRVNGEVVAPK